MIKNQLSSDLLGDVLIIGAIYSDKKVNRSHYYKQGLLESVHCGFPTVVPDIQVGYFHSVVRGLTQNLTGKVSKGFLDVAATFAEPWPGGAEAELKVRGKFVGRVGNRRGQGGDGIQSRSSDRVLFRWSVSWLCGLLCRYLTCSSHQGCCLGSSWEGPVPRYCWGGWHCRCCCR